MPYELQETYGVLGLEKIVIIKLVTIIQNPGNPVRRYVESPCVRSATNENKIAVTQVYFQFLGVKPYRKQTIEFFHVTIGAVMKTYSFYCIPRVGNKRIHVTPAFCQCHNCFFKGVIKSVYCKYQCSEVLLFGLIGISHMASDFLFIHCVIFPAINEILSSQFLVNTPFAHPAG